MRWAPALVLLTITFDSALAIQSTQPQVPDSGTKKTQVVDTVRLRAVTVRDQISASHKYSARWSSAAAKTARPLRDTPQSVAIITQSLIAEQSMQSMSDAMRYLPGVTMAQGEGHRDAPTIRGQNTTADFFVDGVRDDAQYLRDLYNVESVELLAGSNAMAFGRGGGGGVVNRVIKKAQWEPTRDVMLEAGSFAHVRGTLDVGGPLTSRIAARLNGMSEHSSSFRNAVELSRQGFSPSLALQVGDRAIARIGAEYFEDRRVVDRGLPSFRGVPSAAPITMFFGNPDSSRASLELRALSGTIERQLGARAVWRTQARVTSYDKFYQNVFPGALDTSGAVVSLSAYNNMHDRTNLFAQSEAVLDTRSGIAQTLIVGIETVRQLTDNFRRTGFFGGTATSFAAPFDAPTISEPVSFRQNATDADNHVVASTGAFYAQSQLDLSSRWQMTLGARVERFAIRFENHRTNETLGRVDDAVSPRAGLVFKPAIPISLYTSVSSSYLPSAGDQFSSLTATTQTLTPERFTNRELGMKWEVSPVLALTTALYRLDRTNTAAADPGNPAFIVQTGHQRASGIEATITGQLEPGWDLVGTYTSQTASILSRTTAAAAGARVPLVPRQRFSIWNRAQMTRIAAIGVGAIHQGMMYAAIDNSVTLPAFWRFDAAAYLTHFRGVVAQVNIENLLDRRYYPTSQGNNNIMPAAPRTLRFSLTTQVGTERSQF